MVAANVNTSAMACYPAGLERRGPGMQRAWEDKYKGNRLHIGQNRRCQSILFMARLLSELEKISADNQLDK